MKSFVMALLVLTVLTSAAFGQNPGESKVIIAFNGAPEPGLFAANGGWTDGVVIQSANALAGRLPTAAIRGLQHHPNVAYIEEDGAAFIPEKVAKRPSGPTPTCHVDYRFAEKMTDVTLSIDPTYPDQTTVAEGDPAIDEVPYGVSLMQADQAWTTATGAGVKLAIIDTGIQTTHLDLTVSGGANFVPYPYNYPGNSSDYADDNGHGTHVAGTAAARRGNGGVAGVAPDALLYAVKVLDAGGGAQWSWVAKGIDWARLNGMHVASMSLGGGSSKTVRTACDSANGAGVLLVAAAGNSGNTSSPGVNYPAAYTSVMAIAATDEGDYAAYFSSYTNSTTAGAEVDVAAPGTRTWSAVYGGWADSASPDWWNQRPDTTTTLGRAACFSGTSMACPHASGAAALVYQAHPGWTNAQVWARMKSPAAVDPLYDRVSQTTNQWWCEPGATPPGSVSVAKYGAGRLNALKAVAP